MKNVYKVNEEAVKKIAERVYDNGSTVINRNDLEEMFPELAESEDEKIRKELIDFILYIRDKTNITEVQKAKSYYWIAWLEKQGEHANFLSKIQVGDKVTRNEDGVLVNLSQLKRIAKKECEQGTHLPSFDEAQGTPIVEYAEQKLNDKVEQKYETKFHEGEWVFIEEIKGYKQGAFQIKAVNEFGYHFDEYHIIPFMYEELLSKWTIQDAKDGNVLFYDDGWTCIFKRIHGIWYSSYCFITNDGEFHTGYEQHAIDAKINGHVHPATKEQRDLLFQKIKEAGYEWDAEKKELKKIEQKSVYPLAHEKMETERWKEACKAACSDRNYRSHYGLTETRDDYFVDGVHWADEHPKQKPAVWSEEDESTIDDIICYIRQRLNYESEKGKKKIQKCENWLKSLKERVQPQLQWKPSDAQMVSIKQAVSHMKNSACYDSVLVHLLQDLKKLRGE